MNWIRQHRNSAILVGLTLLLPALIYVYTLGALLGVALDYSAERGRLEPRISRIQGLYEQRALIDERGRAAREVARERAYPATANSSELSASLQAQLRQLFSEAGLEVSNSQILPARNEEYFQQIAIKLTVEGSLSGLDTALLELAGLRPRLLIEEFDAYPARRRRRDSDGSQIVTAVIQLFALRVLP